MAGTVGIAFTISKEAYKLIKAGKAVLESGGVRSLTGQFIELAKPSILSSAQAAIGGSGLGVPGAVVNIASSLANNVQSSILQHSVNQANVKLDNIMDQLGALANAMQGLKQVQVLSWVNSAFGLANSGISVVGFRMTLDKLGNVQDRLEMFFDRYKLDKEREHIDSYNKYLMYLKEHLAYLHQRYSGDSSERDSFIQREASIAKNLTDIEAYLRSILSAFRSRTIDGKIGCQIIFTLSIAYAQTVNDFCCQYFYVHGTRHALFKDWISVLDEINSPAFREYLKRHFIFDSDYAAVPPKSKQAAHYVLFESIQQQKNHLALCADSIEQLPEKQYIQLDDRLNQKVFSSLCAKVSDRQGVDVNQLLVQRIEEDDVQILGDIIVVPLTYQ